MRDHISARNGGQILVEALRRNRVDKVFCIPGESYLPVLDSLYSAVGISTIITRHEGAAANMADAYGKLTGRPGICFVTRGPGATHAANGVHTASEDSTPMILFVGQVNSNFCGRGAFQEVDYKQMFGSIAKWVTQIDRLERIPEVVSRAFSIAVSGRPGPVVIALPEDILFNSGMAIDLPPPVQTWAAPPEKSMKHVNELLTDAKRPLVIAGGTGWNAPAAEALHHFAATNELPVAVSFRRQDLFDNRDDHYIGHLGLSISPNLSNRIRCADLLLVIGSRLGEASSLGYTLVNTPDPHQKMIHIHADPDELGRVYRATLPINASNDCAAFALAALPLSTTILN